VFAHLINPGVRSFRRFVGRPLVRGVEGLTGHSEPFPVRDRDVR
jgi:hypothetical protein